MHEYIYALKVNDKTIYIGKTNNPDRRRREHLNDKSGSPKSEAIQKALEDGVEVVMDIIVTVKKGQLGSLEDDEIQKIINSGGKLLNQISGNKGVQMTAVEAHALNKEIQYYKACHKPKKGVQSPSWTRERQREVNRLYEAYQRGEVTLEELKEYSEKNKNEDGIEETSNGR